MNRHLSVELAALRIHSILLDPCLNLNLESRALMLEDASEEAGWDETTRCELFGELEDTLYSGIDYCSAWGIIRRVVSKHWGNHGVPVSST